MRKRLSLLFVIAVLMVNYIAAQRIVEAGDIVRIGETVETTLAEGFSISLELGVSRGDIVTIRLESLSSSFDPILLIERDGDLIAADDNSGGGTTALISGLEINTYADYEIGVRNAISDVEGEHRLRLSVEAASTVEEQAPFVAELGDVSYDSSIEGTFGPFVQSHIYTFEAGLGDVIHIEISPPFEDGFVALYPPINGQANRTSSPYINTSVRRLEPIDNGLRSQTITIRDDGIHSLELRRFSTPNEFSYTISLIREESTVTDCLGLARLLYSARRTEDALEKANCAVEELDSADAYYLRASIHVYDENYQAALEDMNSVIERDSTSGAYYYYRGLIYNRLNRYSDAREDLVSAENATDPYNGSFLYVERAYANAFSGSYSEAIEDINAVANDLYAYHWVYFVRGLAYFRLNNFEAAEADLIRSIYANPTNYLAHIYLAQIYIKLQNYELAQHFLEAAIEINPNQMLGFVWLAYLYAYQDNFDAALALLDETLSEHPEFSLSFLYTRALLHYHAGNYAESITAINEAIEQVEANDGNPISYYSLRADSYIALGDYDAALAEYEALAGYNFNFSSLKYLIALGASQPEDAAAQFRSYDLLQRANHSTSITIGDAIDANLSSSGMLYEIPIVLPADTSINIRVNSVDFDPTLMLVSPDGVPIRIDYDSGPNQNAALMNFATGLGGTYTLLVLADFNEQGLASVSLEANVPFATESIDACPAIVETAYRTAQTACGSLRSEELCYAHSQVTSIPELEDFRQAGDIVAIKTIESLRLSGMITSDSDWGIVQMRLAVVDSEGQAGDASLVLFGDVNIAQSGNVSSITLTGTANNTINVRGGPSTNNAVVGSLASGEPFTLIGRNSSSDWGAINYGDGQAGWVSLSLVTVDGDINSLTEVTTAEPNRANETENLDMQGFSLRTGQADTPCNAAPASGILIQTPRGIGRISLRINEVIIDLGSTAYIQAIAGDEMRIYLLEGSATVSTVERSVAVPAGTFVSIPMNANNEAIASPDGPFTYASSDVDNLPLELLPEAIIVATPLANLADALTIPQTGNWETDWTLGRIQCIDFRSEDYQIEVIEDGRALLVNGVYAPMSGLNQYTTGPIPVGGSPAFSVVDDVQLVFLKSDRMVFNVISPTQIEGTAERLSHPANVNETEAEPLQDSCEFVTNTFTLHWSGE